MILHFGYGGRLGNQLFVLGYIEGLRGKSEWVISTRLGAALKSIRPLPRHFDCSGRLAIFLTKKVFQPLVENLLVPFRVFSSHQEKHDGRIACTRGVLPITYYKGNYQFAGDAAGLPSFRLRRAYLEYAADILNEAEGRTPLFVHVRRGDYLTYKVHGKQDPSLPAEYYRSAIGYLLERVRDPFLFFLGDEPEWLLSLFGNLPHAKIARRTASIDLAIMSLCWGGVISNSTFAWWGAFLCRQKEPIIAPQFWLGWRSGKWHPPFIRTPMFEYFDVLAGKTVDIRN